MFKYIKTHRKQMLAIFSVFLMIAFALPSYFGANRALRKVVVGHIGKAELTNAEVQRAQQLWTVVWRRMAREIGDPNDPMRGGRRIPAAMEILGDENVALSLARQIEANDDMYALLLREADAMGIQVSPDEVNTVLTYYKESVTEGDAEANYAEAVTSLLKIRHAYDRAVGAVQVSDNYRDHALAGNPAVAAPAVATLAATRRKSAPVTAAEEQRYFGQFRFGTQAVAVSAIPVSLDDYIAQVPAKLDEAEVRKHYAKYKDTVAGVTPTNPWGFGYKTPDRVQVEYIEIPADLILQAARAKITEPEARKYYLLHPERFPTTRPAPDQRLLISAAPGPGVAAAKPPATQPSIPAWAKEINAFKAGPAAPPMTYDDYREQVYATLARQNAADLTDSISRQIIATSNADYVAWQKARSDAATTRPAATNPTSMPAGLSLPQTALGGSYSDRDYFLALANRIQRDHGVRLPVERRGELMTSAQLAELKGIAESLDAATFDAIRQRDPSAAFQLFAALRFSNYAVRFADPLMTPESRDLARRIHLRVLALYEVSPGFEQFSPGSPTANRYFFRLAAIRAAESPRSIDEVYAKVESDLRKLKAFELATAAATKLAEEARTKRLYPVAEAHDLDLFTTEPVSWELPEVVGYTVKAEATSNFVQGAYALANAVTPEQPHPVGLISLPQMGTVLAAEVQRLAPPWTVQTLPAERLAASLGLTAAWHRVLRDQWFDYNDLAARLGYKPVEGYHKKPAPAPAQPEQPEDDGST